MCGDEWIQLLRANIEAWLKYIIQNVNAGLLGEAPAAAAAAEVLALPEVRCMLTCCDGLMFDAVCVGNKNNAHARARAQHASHPPFKFSARASNLTQPQYYAT